MIGRTTFLRFSVIFHLFDMWYSTKCSRRCKNELNKMSSILKNQIKYIKTTVLFLRTVKKMPAVWKNKQV